LNVQQAIEEVKKIPIAKVYNELWSADVPEGETAQVACHLHGVGEDNLPSARIYNDSNLMYCWGCATIRDTLQLVKDVRQVGFKEALTFLVETFIGEEVDWKAKDTIVQAKADQELREECKVWASVKVKRIEELIDKYKGPVLDLNATLDLYLVVDFLQHYLDSLSEDQVDKYIKELQKRLISHARQENG